MVPIGSRDSYLRILTEYGLAEDEIRGLTIMHPAMAAGGSPGPREYLVHASLLRSHREFPCAGDQQTRSFCEEIAYEMVTLFGIPFDQAVARVNRQRSAPGGSGPHTADMIAGLDIAYHETPGVVGPRHLLRTGLLLVETRPSAHTPATSLTLSTPASTTASSPAAPSGERTPAAKPITQICAAWQAERRVLPGAPRSATRRAFSLTLTHSA
jgi:hypothetical protein